MRNEPVTTRHGTKILLLLLAFLIVWSWTEISEYEKREDFKSEVKKFMVDHEQRVESLENTAD